MPVTTGWRYASSSDDRPSCQYCYMHAATAQDGVERKIDLAITRHDRDPYLPQAGVDRELFETAMARCV